MRLMEWKHGAGFRDKVKHIQRIDQLFTTRTMQVDEQLRVIRDEEQTRAAMRLNSDYADMKVGWL